MGEQTLLKPVPCPVCGSTDIRYRVKKVLHHLCRRCGKSWNEEGED